jgi:hypothetical protein
MHLRTCGSFLSAKKLGLANRKSTSYKYANGKKDWVRTSQIRKVPHLRKVRKSNKLYKPAKLRICDLRNLFSDRPPLEFT